MKIRQNKQSNRTTRKKNSYRYSLIICPPENYVANLPVRYWQVKGFNIFGSTVEKVLSWMSQCTSDGEGTKKRRPECLDKFL